MNRPWSAGVVVVIVLGLTSCGASPDSADTSLPAITEPTPTAVTTTTAATPPASTTAASTTTAVPTTVATAPPSTTTTTEPEPDVTFPLDVRYLVYGPDGIAAVGTDGEVTQLSAEPTAVALALGDSLIVSQEGAGLGSVRLRRSGPIVIDDSDGRRELPLAENERMFLYDAGYVDGRAVIVATSIAGDGWEADEVLLLIDAVTGERTELGVVGYYEARVEEARLAGDFVLVKPFAQGLLFEARSLDGRQLWSVVGTGDFEQPGHLVVLDDEVWLIDPGFEGEGFDPVLDVARYRLADGVLVSNERMSLDAHFGGGFCLIPDWDGERLVCEESYGGPFTIEVTSGAVAPLSDLELGTASAVRTVP